MGGAGRWSSREPTTANVPSPACETPPCPACWSSTTCSSSQLASRHRPGPEPSCSPSSAPANQVKLSQSVGSGPSEWSAEAPPEGHRSPSHSLVPVAPLTAVLPYRADLASWCTAPSSQLPDGRLLWLFHARQGPAKANNDLSILLIAIVIVIITDGRRAWVDVRRRERVMYSSSRRASKKTSAVRGSKSSSRRNKQM